MSDEYALFVSPHMDDVAFSCGGTVAKKIHNGVDVINCTVFSAGGRPFSEFSMRCQTDKGIPEDVDYLALRKKEDLQFGRVIGLSEISWLDFPEAPYRGYGSSEELFDEVKEIDEEMPGRIANEIRKLAGKYSIKTFYFPSGIGYHVDHVLVNRSAGLLVDADDIGFDSLYFYHDIPYSFKEDPFSIERGTPDRFMYEDISDFLGIKLTAASSYRSQLDYQFGGESGMRSLISGYADKISKMIGRFGYHEAFTVARKE